MSEKKRSYRNELKLYIRNEMRIRCRVNCKLHYATVRRDGTILYNKKVYNSPSPAVRTITKNESNGWVYWKYERTPGEWVALRELRKK